MKEEEEIWARRLDKEWKCWRKEESGGEGKKPG